MPRPGGELTADEILRRSRERILDGWCQGADARDERGREVPPWSDEARSWSILGAVAGTGGADGGLDAVPVARLGEAVVALGEAAETDSLVRWNDVAGRTQDEVVALFDRALALLPAPPVRELRAVE